MADIFLMEGPEMQKRLDYAIANWHPDLALAHDKIAVVMREKASKSGGVVVLGKSKKASPILQILGKKNYVFILELALDEWQPMPEENKMALLDHLLCACGVKTDEKSGGLSYFIKKPEIQMFKAELRRHGVWMDISDEEEEGDDGDQAATTLEKVFLRKIAEDMEVEVSMKVRGDDTENLTNSAAIDDALEG
jgi:hypothetical protein